MDTVGISEALEHRLDLNKGGVGKLSLEMVIGEVIGVSFHLANLMGVIYIYIIHMYI